MKNYRKQLNVIPTTTQQNLAAAKLCDTLPKAQLLFRRLEHANDRGTGGSQFDELQDHFDRKEYPYDLQAL